MPTKDPARRAVVTGLGAVTPIGNTAKAYWENLLAGVSGVGPITQFDPVRSGRPHRRRGQGLRPDHRAWTARWHAA